MTGVAAGTLSATSFDAVNGSQLFATNQSIASLGTTSTSQAAAIATLNTTVTSQGSTVATHTTQITALQTSDTAQNNRLTALEAASLSIGEQLNRVDDRAAGGTAVAIALGGNAFLPDHKFNLTGNVGVYRSKVAAALQVGAMVGHDAAINAGLATGFSRDGKVGARVGFTIGW
ncbi:MAG: hypothetical protein ACJ8FO_12050 [Sphingomicrobium sp.]